MGAENRSPVRILVVDDDPGDVLMIEEALEGSTVEKTISVVSDGQEAMEFLRGEGRHQGALRPDMILLDLNMPRMDGLELLRELDADPVLAMVPVVVMTTSDDQGDLSAAYAAGASSYFVKPVSFAEFVAQVGSILDYWSRVTPPPS